jgi:hypothetical protein
MPIRLVDQIQHGHDERHAIPLLKRAGDDMRGENGLT